MPPRSGPLSGGARAATRAFGHARVVTYNRSLNLLRATRMRRATSIWPAIPAVVAGPPQRELPQ